MFTIELNMIESHFCELEKRIKELAKSESFVGYDQSQGIHEDSGLSYPHLVGVLSAGYSPNNLPARPIFDITHQTFTFKDSSMKKDLTKYFSDIANKSTKITTKQINENFAKDLSDEVLSIFGNTNKLASNAESTIKKKGRDEPLVDTGNLKNNLAYSVNDEAIQLVKNLG